MKELKAELKRGYTSWENNICDDDGSNTICTWVDRKSVAGDRI